MEVAAFGGSGMTASSFTRQRGTDAGRAVLATLSYGFEFVENYGKSDATIQRISYLNPSNLQVLQTFTFPVYNHLLYGGRWGYPPRWMLAERASLIRPGHQYNVILVTRLIGQQGHADAVLVNYTENGTQYVLRTITSLDVKHQPLQLARLRAVAAAATPASSTCCTTTPSGTCCAACVGAAEAPTPPTTSWSASASTSKAALFQLATDLPAAVLARLLGIHITVAVAWQHAFAGDWAAYAAEVSRRTRKDEPL